MNWSQCRGDDTPSPPLKYFRFPIFLHCPFLHYCYSLYFVRSSPCLTPARFGSHAKLAKAILKGKLRLHLVQAFVRSVVWLSYDDSYDQIWAIKMWLFCNLSYKQSYEWYDKYWGDLDHTKSRTTRIFKRKPCTIWSTFKIFHLSLEKFHFDFYFIGDFVEFLFEITYC